MRLSKEIKVLAAVLALFLLVGIGCGAAVITNDSAVSDVKPIIEYNGTWVYTHHVAADEVYLNPVVTTSIDGEYHTEYHVDPPVIA